MVAISALTMMEGRYSSCWISHFTPPFEVVFFLLERYSYGCGSIWRNVRGAGLAYGTSMDHDVFAGLIKLEIYRSSQPSAGVA